MHTLTRLALGALVAGAAFTVPLTANAAGVSGPAFYVDGVRYRTVATPTELSGTGAPASSWDTIYSFGSAQPSVATSAPRESRTRLRQARVLPLEGANMPAVMLECGMLSNTIDRKRVSDPVGLATRAEVLARALERYAGGGFRP